MCRHLLPRPQNSQRPWQISMQTGRRKINHPNNLFTKNFLSLSLSLWLGLFLGALRKIEVTCTMVLLEQGVCSRSTLRKVSLRKD
jgi:hypothetical protein